MATVDEVLARLNPKTAESFRRATDIKVELLPTPSLGLNLSIGGIRRGGFTMIYGNKGAGKTTVALGLVAQGQRLGMSTLWIDAEKNFTPEWARKNGVNPDEVLVDSRTLSIAAITDKVKEAVVAGIDIVVVDSTSVLLSGAFFEDPKKDTTEIKDFANTRQIGSQAKDLKAMLNIINAVNENSIVILINQINDVSKGQMMGVGFQGGRAMEHAPSTILKVWRTPSEKVEGDVQIAEDIVVKRVIGANISMTVEKNRGPGMGDIIKYRLITEGPYVGIDLSDEVITYGIEYGLIRKTGAWLKYGEEKYNGRDAMIKALKDDPTLERTIYEEILAKSIR